jgi:hypothetical protein
MCTLGDIPVNNWQDSYQVKKNPLRGGGLESIRIKASKNAYPRLQAAISD